MPLQSVCPLGHAHAPDWQVLPPVHAVQLVQPQLAVVPAQYAAAPQTPSVQLSDVHESPSLHVAQPERATCVPVTVYVQLVPAHECVRYCWP